MKRRCKRLMVIIPVAAVCVAGAGTVGYFKVAHTKLAQKTAAKTQSAEAKKGNLSKTSVGTGKLDLAENAFTELLMERFEQDEDAFSIVKSVRDHGSHVWCHQHHVSDDRCAFWPVSG